MNNGNGEHENLPDDRKAAIAYGLEQYQRVQNERDFAIADRNDLSLRLQAALETIAVLDSQIANLESRNATLQIDRDAAVGHKLKWEALFVSISAQMRAFEVPAAPLVIDRTDHVEPQEDALAALHRLVEESGEGSHLRRKAQVPHDLSRQ